MPPYPPAVEPRPPPPVTIEGGPGWQLVAPPGDTIGEDARAPREPPWAPVLRQPAVVAAVLAAAVGFGSATLVADWRTDRLGETDAGTLSLEVGAPENWGYQGLARTADGRVATAVVLDVRNTGPRPIALHDVRLEGAGWAAEDLGGRRVAAGGAARVSLVRPVDCDDLPAGYGGSGSSVAVLVRAVTDAGPRQQRVVGAVDSWLTSGELDRQACGEVPAEQAVQELVSRQRNTDAGTELRVRLGNASRRPVAITRVRVPPGLRVEVLDGSGELPLPLPLALPAGDFDEPKDPYEAAQPGVPLTLRVRVADCARLGTARPAVDYGRPLVELDVEGQPGSGTAFLGDGASVVSRLQADFC